MNDLKILLTSAGSPAFPGIFRSLKINGERDIKIIATDIQEDIYGAKIADNFYQVPSTVKETVYLSKIKEIIDKEKIDVIIPLSTAENIVLSKNKDKLDIPILVSDYPQIKEVTDKGFLYGVCKAGVTSLKSIRCLLCESKEDIFKIGEVLGYPDKVICVKPVDGEGSRGFIILDAKANTTKEYLQKGIRRLRLEQFKSLFTAKTFPKLLFMDYINGQEYTVDLLMDDYKWVGGSVRSRDRVVNGISNIGTIVDRYDILEKCGLLAEHFQLNYNIGMQVIETGNGDVYLLEINPRLQGSTVMATYAGLNLPYLGLKCLLNEFIELPKIKYGTRIYRYWEEHTDNPEGYKKKKLVIAVDFDGVIIKYKDKWEGQQNFGPIDSKKHLQELSREYAIVIYTSRSKLENVRAFLIHNEIPFDKIMAKPDAIAYIDDRAIEHSAWPETIKKLEKIKKYWTKYFK